jgi:hypothetical protein
LRFAASRKASPTFIGYAVFLGELYFRQERLIFPGRLLAGDFQFQFD